MKTRYFNLLVGNKIIPLVHSKLKKIIFICIGYWFTIPIANAQNIGDYRTKTSGNWANASTWEMYNGSDWVDAMQAPTATDGNITLLSPYEITVSDPISINQTMVESGAKILHTGGDISIVDGAERFDFTIKGTYVKQNFANGIKIIPFARIKVDSGGVFDYASNANTIPTATWHSQSILLISGITNSTKFVSGTNQTFGKVIFESPLQTARFTIGSGFKTSDALVVNNTGTGLLEIGGIAPNAVVLGNYIQNGGNVYVNRSTMSAMLLIINNDFVLNGGKFVVSNSSSFSAPGTINVEGDFTLNTGVFDLVGINGRSNGTVEVKGQVEIRAAALLTKSAIGTMAGSANFNFLSGYRRSFIKYGNITGAVNFTLVPGSIVDFADFVVTGNGWFVVNPGAKMYIGHRQGIAQSGATGNVQVTSFRTFHPYGYYVYNGTQDQITGTGLPLEIGAVDDAASVGGFGVENYADGHDVSLTNPLKLNEALYLGGGYIISNKSKMLTMGTTGYIEKGGFDTSYVAGIMGREMDNSFMTYIFPVGDDSVYKPIGVRPSTFDFQRFLAQAFDNPYPDLISIADEGMKVSDKEYWDLYQEIVNQPAIVRLYWNERSGITPELLEALVVAQYAKFITPPGWINLGNNDISPDEHWVEAIAYEFAPRNNPFTFGFEEEGNPLPVKMLSFNGRFSAGLVYLKWNTANEINNDYFVVEKSFDGKNFNDIGKVDGNGTTNTAQTYAYTDLNADPSQTYKTLYYRLKQVDTDGKFEYTKIIAINTDARVAKQLTVSPVPATDKINIAYNGTADSEVIIYAIDNTGKVVLQSSYIAQAGMNRTQINIDQLQTGVYYIQIITGGAKQQVKFIKI